MQRYVRSALDGVWNTLGQLSIATRFEDAAHSWLRLAEDLESVEVLLDEQRAAIRRR
jgi:hypothetical protein